MKKRLIYIVIVVVALAIGVSFKPKNIAHAEDTRVVTVHIDGETRTIATNADTVKGVLVRLGTTIGEHDKTEPELSHAVNGVDFTINVYRARPIVVVDGANNYTVMTAERSPRQIAEDAGFATKTEDEFNFERSDDPFAGAPGTQMVIKRAKTITFDLYGTSSSLSTNENTVDELLKEKGVTLEDGDELNTPKEARITEGMTVSIARVGRAVETVEEPAAFPVEQIKDAQQPLGYKKIQEPGKNGKKLVTYEVVVRNGGAPTRTAVKEVVTEEPVKQVVIVGAKQALNIPGNCGEWLAQAGITNSDAIWLIGKESGCNPGAVNRSSGACGIPQALPCSKLPCPLDAAGAVCQLKWMNNYVLNRYGSWAAARAFHASRGWY
jgi:uncharacterized protein YabE (DUF348 family)